MEFFVYILRTNQDSLYTGQTNNLERRLREHKRKSTKSARYIRCFESCELVYFETYQSRGEAMRREAEIKSWKKEKKLWLVVGQSSDLT